MKGKIFFWSSERSATTIVVYKNRFRPEGRENFHLSRVFVLNQKKNYLVSRNVEFKKKTMI